MRLRNITGSREVIAESPYVVPEDTLESCPGTWHEIFGNDHPIHIEIGMGKGRFLHTLAKSNPQINYVGIENIPVSCSVRSRKWRKMSFPIWNSSAWMPKISTRYSGRERSTGSIWTSPIPGRRTAMPRDACPPDSFWHAMMWSWKRGHTGIQDRQPSSIRFCSRGTGTRRLAGAGDHLRSAQWSCTDGRQCHDGIRGEILFHWQPYLQIHYF